MRTTIDTPRARTESAILSGGSGVVRGPHCGGHPPSLGPVAGPAPLDRFVPFPYIRASVVTRLNSARAATTETDNMALPADSFEFELTDFGSARQALDEPPPGVKEAVNLMPGYWEARRRKPVPSDRALTGFAIEWLLSLPSEIRPKAVCDKYPRIVNQMAERWGNHDRMADALMKLLDDDERGNRQGFPEDVAVELRCLLEHVVQQAATGHGTSGGGAR